MNYPSMISIISMLCRAVTGVTKSLFARVMPALTVTIPQNILTNQDQEYSLVRFSPAV